MTDSVAVIVCTHLHERLGQLRAALHSLECQTRQPDEVVVVVDGDESLAGAVRQVADGARVVATGDRAGLAAARNAGAAASSADIVLFLDDDALADPDWIECLTDAIDEPDVLGAFGQSTPLWAATRPAWLSDEFLWTLGCSYAGQPMQRARVRNVYGGCCGLRRELFTELDGYDARLGRGPASAGGGEEAALCLRARRRWPRASFAFEPRAQIRHRVPADRLTLAYVLRRAYDEGRMKAAVALAEPDALRPERRFAWRLPRVFARHVLAGIAGDLHGLARACGLVGMATAVVAGLVVGHVRERAAPRYAGGAPIGPAPMPGSTAAPLRATPAAHGRRAC